MSEVNEREVNYILDHSEADENGISLRAINHDYLLLCGVHDKSAEPTGRRSAIDNG